MQGWTASTKHGVTRKRSTKRLKHTGYFALNLVFTHSLNLFVNTEYMVAGKVLLSYTNLFFQNDYEKMKK